MTLWHQTSLTSLPSESYVSQLLLFIHKIYTSFIDGCDGSGIFLTYLELFIKFGT